MEPTGCASLSSHHHPVCLPSPWQIAGNLKRRNCRIGSVFSTGLKQCHPSKFQCIKRVCDQANYPLGWRECTRYKCLNASARVKCCCASKSRGKKETFRRDRTMFATCIEKAIGGRPSDQWVPTQLSSRFKWIGSFRCPYAGSILPTQKPSGVQPL